MEVNSIELSNVIKDIAAGPFGSNLKVSSFVESGFPIIDGANLKGYKVTDNITKFVTEEKARSLHRAIAQRGDVIITISGTLGQIAYIPKDSKFEEYLVSQRQFRVTFDSDYVYVPYIVFYFHTYEGQQKILSFANQVGVPALVQPIKNFKKICIDIPNIEIQKAIAGVIETINYKIELNERINQNLEQQVQAMFKSLFVDFEPFDGNMPPNWKYTTFGEVCHNIREKTNDNAHIVFSAVNTGELQPSQEFFTKQVFSKDISNYLKVPSKSFAYNPSRVNIGSIGLNTFDYEGCVSPVYVVFSVENGYEAYFNYLIKSSSFREEVKSRASGSVRQSLNYRDLALIELIYPERFFAQKFNDYFWFIQNKKNQIANEVKKLIELRDILLPRLMSGELDVLNLEP